MKQSIDFYTTILDFTLKDKNVSADDWVVDLVNGDIELQLTILESDALFGSVVNIHTDDVDSRFKKYLANGLDISGKKESPVHQGPVDQSWGMREFYVTDADGNTLRFCQPFTMPKARYLNAWPYQEGRRMSLPVKDAIASVSFYTRVMNFREGSRNTNPVLSIVLERDDIQMAIAENGGDPTQEGCFFEVDNIEMALKELQLNGLKKEMSAINVENHGGVNWKTFFVVAPDGLCYCIGEKMK